MHSGHFRSSLENVMLQSLLTQHQLNQMYKLSAFHSGQVQRQQSGKSLPACVTLVGQPCRQALFVHSSHFIFKTTDLSKLLYYTWDKLMFSLNCWNCLSDFWYLMNPSNLIPCKCMLKVTFLGFFVTFPWISLYHWLEWGAFQANHTISLW
jgi:hypothetical protein